MWPWSNLWEETRAGHGTESSGHCSVAHFVLSARALEMKANVYICFVQVCSLESLKDFGECVVALQTSVIKKFFQGFMAPKQKRRKHQGEDSTVKSEEVDEEKRVAEEAKVWSCSGVGGGGACLTCCLKGGAIVV